ncbi:hypothetical protein Taro_000658 [Colocasia esculenta]|uniref:Uncharacterized protein n=1 Tax=Colocasia esculenta TaxID=4460 RepID=A0A843T8F3_COLES|nr:hypothetical protein [Colocasia esculenta]
MSIRYEAKMKQGITGQIEKKLCPLSKIDAPFCTSTIGFSNKLGSRVASLERWGSGERLGKIVVFLNLALHQPRNLQRVLSVQSF